MVDETVTSPTEGCAPHFLRQLFAPTGVRFQPTYLPFTEPSAQVDIASPAGEPREADPSAVLRGKGWARDLGPG